MKQKIITKTMVQNMSFQQRAKLLFADRNLQGDSKGKDRLLGVLEEQLIIDECQRKGEINELNRLNDIFNLISLAVVDVHIATTILDHKMERICMTGMSIFLQSRWSDITDELLWDISTKDKKIADKAEKLIKKKLGEAIPKMFSMFSPREDDEGGEIDEPNIYIQKMFLSALKAFHDLKRCLYYLEYLKEKAGGMDLISEKDKATLAQADNELGDFEELDGFLKILNIYKIYLDEELINAQNLKHPDFAKLLIDFEESLKLTDEDKKEARNFIDQKLRNA